jgi:hypothetical protein
MGMPLPCNGRWYSYAYSIRSSREQTAQRNATVAGHFVRTTLLWCRLSYVCRVVDKQENQPKGYLRGRNAVRERNKLPDHGRISTYRYRYRYRGTVPPTGTPYWYYSLPAILAP